ncbi:MAG: DUF4369 domain-containing protein [Bacteroidales bacterium]|nr:DUF4369 domain-containing protein [Bacteroidales bacterium]
MRKHFLLIGILVLLLSACQNRNVSVTISGNLSNANDQMIRLALITSDGMDFIDSTNLHNGQFEFKISSENELIKERENAPMMFQLFLSEDNCLATMAMKGEHLKITADANDMARTYNISGGEEAVLIHQLDSSLTAFVIPSEKLYEEYQKTMEDDSARAEIEAQYVVMLQNHRQYLENFIEKHPNNMASYIAFYQSYNRRNFFDIYRDLDVLKKINANMEKVYPESEYVKSMKNIVEMVEMQMSRDK